MNPVALCRFSLLFLGVLLPVAGLVGCGATSTSSSTPISKPDIPRRDEEYVKVELYKYLFDEFQINEYWATPLLPMDKWHAEYQGEGVWLVRAYGVNEDYAGTWSVTEVGNDIKPWDENASESEASKGFIRMPVRPPFVLGYGGLPQQHMVQAVQAYIAALSANEVSDAPELAEIRRLIRQYFPLEWAIRYTSSTWRVTTIHGENVVHAYVEPESGRIRVYGQPVW